jgi:hypothetical protein
VFFLSQCVSPNTQTFSHDLHPLCGVFHPLCRVSHPLWGVVSPSNGRNKDKNNDEYALESSGITPLFSRFIGFEVIRWFTCATTLTSLAHSSGFLRNLNRRCKSSAHVGFTTHVSRQGKQCVNFLDVDSRSGGRVIRCTLASLELECTLLTSG